MDAFVQRTSILRRLLYLFSVTAVFFLVAFVGVFIASQTALRGLKAVNEANNLFNLSLQSLEGVDECSRILGRAAEAETESEDIREAFDAAIEHVAGLLESAQGSPGGTPEVAAQLASAREALSRMREVGSRVLRQPGDQISRAASGDTARDLLIAEQFRLDANEALRKSQILLKARSDTLFEDVYRSRNQPLIVGVVLALLCFGFVAAAGIATTRRLSRSILQLQAATDAVARGNFGFRAQVATTDELGRLTHAFNLMLEQLETGRARAMGLQKLSASLSQALQPAQVAQAVTVIGREAARATSATVAVLAEEGKYLEILGIEGYPRERIEEFRKLRLDAPFPLCEVIRTGKAIWLEGLGAIRKALPKEFEDSLLDRALVAIPLEVEGRSVGSMTFGYAQERTFAEEDKTLIHSIATLCAQALHRARLYSDAREAVRVRDEFLSIASHELKTPLTPLQMQIQTLARLSENGRLQTLPQPKISELLGTSRAQLTRLNRLIEELLDVSRIRTGRLEIERVRLDLSALVAEVLRRFATAHGPSGSLSRIEPRIQPEVTGDWDPLRLEQVVTNLVTNAIRYGRDRPIRVALHGDAETAILEVSDEGIGIAPEDLERIFGRFERAVPARHFGGLGLGLYITRQIVEHHSGTIGVESKVGEGSTFTVRLPRWAQARAQGAPQSA